MNKRNHDFRAKKQLGQHFLKDETIAKKIVDALTFSQTVISPDTICGVIPFTSLLGATESTTKEGFQMGELMNVLEIGPGTGVLTKYFLEKTNINFKMIELDLEAIDYLKKVYPQVIGSLYYGDFLKIALKELFTEKFVIIGNFPYNISSQIFFKVLDYKEQIPQVVCMLQKEVAMRLSSPPGSKEYGILSVLLQAWYDIEYLFTVEADVFIPPPKVKSGVIRLIRNNRTSLGCDEVLFKEIVKTGFNQRRKTLRNSLKPLTSPCPPHRGGSTLNPPHRGGKGEVSSHPLFDKRPEQLSVEQFIELALLIGSE